MKILAVFIGALLAALIARQKPPVPGQAISFENGVEPSRNDFEVAIAQAWEVTKEAFTAASETVDSVAVGVGAAVAQAFGTKYDTIIYSAAAANNLDPALLYRLLYEESRFREDIITGKVRSPVGALGIAQFMPATAVEELGSVEAALDPSVAIPGAARYLAKLIRSTGSVSAGVAAYNWGVGNVKRKGLANAPTETVNYVKAITGSNLKG